MIDFNICVHIYICISDVSRASCVVRIFISVLTFRMHGTRDAARVQRKSAGINIAHFCETRTAP